MAGRPEIINKSKASSHPLKPGRFYTGSVTAVLSNGKINVKIPELGTQYGPLMPLNTTSTSRYVVGDSVKCAFADEFFNEIIVFGSTRVKEDVFAVSDRGIDRYANQSARNTDIPTPEEGRVVYLLDSDELQIYNGTEWITVIDTGNSENITAATLVATSASIGSLTVTSASTLTVLGSANLTASTTIGDISSTELSYLNGVTSAIQTQINTKSPSASPTFTGPATIRAAATQDGVILQGRAGGTSTYAVTLTPGTLTGSRTITLPDTAGTVITTGDSGTVTSTMIANDTIVNADINSAAAIADTKLATISTEGKVSNSATTATSANTASAIVARDASGNFSAGTITATLSGTATNAGTVASLSVHTGRNNEANKIVRTDGNGYIQAGYINSSNGDEANNSAPVRVWGTNGSDSYMRSYLRTALMNAANITGQTGMWTSTARPGPYRLYRRDDNSDFSVQTYWTGSRWRLYGYYGDGGHADTHVGYADSAGSAGSASNSSYSYYVYSLNPYAGDAYTGNVVKFQWDQPYIRFWIDGTNVFSARNGSAITGTAAKTFVIDHPIKTDRYLVHACAEGPTSDVFYRGIGQLTNGFCTIELPEYFESLTEVEGRTVVLTPIYDNLSDEEIMPDQPEVKHSLSANLSATEVRNGKFNVAICGGYVVPDQKFYWRVDAVRKHTSFDVEPLIGEVSIAGEGPYTYVQR